MPSTDETKPEPGDVFLRGAAWRKPTYLGGAASRGGYRSDRSAVNKVSLSVESVMWMRLALMFLSHIKS